ncbi:MAG TPA: dienelactone hydrolase family protein [Acidimicrobiales bacterium]|nr:dienelactone hydrolase family protein [Acidimicrobiales bacterium]
MTVREERVPYDVDGVEMVGTLFVDDAADGPRPSVLVFGGGTGFAPFHASRARRLAELGYCAFGADHVGGGRVLGIDSPERAALFEGLTFERRRLIGRAAHDALVERPACDRERLAAIGFCFGGGMAVQLARTGVDLKAIVGFHPGISPTPEPEQNRNITGSVLMCCGTADPLVPVEQVYGWLEQMTSAGVDCTVELYAGVGHVFTDPDADSLGIEGCGYDRRADERSWASMLRLFAETIDA